MNRNALKGLIAIVIILVANIGIFMLTSYFTTAFWISYLFAMLAALITVYVEIFFAAREKLIFKYPISAVTYCYLIAELIVAFAMASFFRYWILFSFLLQLCIFAVYLVAFLSVLLHNATTKEQQEIRGQDIVDFRYIKESMNAVIAKMPYEDPNRKIVQHAYDSIASGQVKSDISVKALEEQILTQIAALDQALSNQQQERILESCRRIESAAEERKRRLIQRTPF